MKHRQYIVKEMYEISTILHDTKLLKKADSNIFSSLFTATSQQVPEEAKKASTLRDALKFFSPGILYLVLNSLGFGIYKYIFTFLASLFGFDIGAIFETIIDKLSSANISKETPINPDDIHRVAISAAEQHIGNPSDEELEKRLRKGAYLNNEQLFKLGFTNNKLKKYAAAQTRGLLVKIIGSIMSFVFRAFLISAGFNILGYLGRKMFGIGETGKVPEKQLHRSTQTRFFQSETLSTKAENVSSRWQVPVTVSNIPDMLYNWAVEVYPEVKPYKNLIQSTDSFENLVNEIESANEGPDIGSIFIPEHYHTKKSVVDQFIDDVANAAPRAPIATTPAPTKEKLKEEDLEEDLEEDSDKQ